LIDRSSVLDVEAKILERLLRSGRGWDWMYPSTSFYGW
jgi:hypothetical protein